MPSINKRAKEREAQELAFNSVDQFEFLTETPNIDRTYLYVLMDWRKDFPNPKTYLLYKYRLDNYYYFLDLNTDKLHALLLNKGALIFYQEKRIVGFYEKNILLL